MDIYKKFDQKVGQLSAVYNNNVCKYVADTLDNYVKKTNLLITILEFTDTIKEGKYIANDNLNVWEKLIDDRLENQINDNFMQFLIEKPKFSQFRYQFNFGLQTFNKLKKEKKIILKK